MKTIHIGIDGGDNNFESSIKSGIQRLVSSFVQSISDKNSYQNKFFYYFFSRSSVCPKSKTIQYVNLPHKFFSSVFVPLRCLFDRIDVYLGFSGTIPSMIRIFKKTIVFIHDFGFYDYPEYYSDSNKLIWQTNYSIYAANRIIVFSKTIRNQLLKRFPTIDPNHLISIYPGVNYFVQKHNSFHKKPDHPYFLYVGVIKKIKNIDKLLVLFSKFLISVKRNDIKLVLIGVKEQPYWDQLTKSKPFIHIKNNIIVLENVSDQVLLFYYQHCIALLNTSLVEGFCYPVVEALSLGKKVITNDLTLYTEFKPYFEGLCITKSDQNFLSAMKEEVNKKNMIYSIKHNPFKWSEFTSKLLHVMKDITQ